MDIDAEFWHRNVGANLCGNGAEGMLVASQRCVVAIFGEERNTKFVVATLLEVILTLEWKFHAHSTTLNHRAVEFV